MTVLVIAGLWRLLNMLQWSWFQDDWVYVARAHDMSFVDYIGQNYNGHLMPGQFAIIWVMTALDPLNFTWAALVVWTMSMLSLAVWALVFRSLFGAGWVATLPMVPLALSPVFLPLALWNAAGLETFSLQLFMGLALLATLAWVRSGRPRHAAAVVAAYCAGIFFWEKALLIAIPVLGLAFLLKRTRAGHPDWRPLLVLGVGLLVPVLVYAPLYLAGTRQASGSQPTLGQVRTLGEAANFYWTALTAHLLPALVGGPWRAQDAVAQVVPTPSTWFQWLLLSTAVALTAWALVHRVHAWIPLTAGALYCATSWGLVLTSSRYDYLGDFGALDPRYSADSIPVVLLMGTLAVVESQIERRRPSAMPPLRAHPPGWAAPALCVALLASALFTNSAIWDQVAPTSPKPWADNLIRDARAVGRATVFDSNAPKNVVLSVAFPDDARLSRLLSPLALPLTFNGPTDQMLAADAQGRLRRAEFGVSARSLPGPVPDCGYLIKPGETAFVPMDTGRFDWNWGVVIRYFTRQSGALVVKTDSKTSVVPITAGLGTRQTVVVDSTSALQLWTSPGSGTVCVGSVTVGLVSAGDAAP